MMNKDQIEKLLKANPYDSRFSFRDNEKSRSEVWCMFEVIFFENEQLPFAHCKDCGAILSYSGKIGTASLLRHKCYLLTLASKQRIAALGPTSIVVENTPLEFISTPTPKPLPIILSVERTVPDNLICSIAQKQVEYVVRDLQPISTMESNGFKSFAQTLINLGADYGKQDVENILSKRKGLEKTIMPAVYNNIKDEIKEILKGKHVSFTLELWEESCRNKRSFLTLSAHTITDYKFQKIVLGTRELVEKVPSNIEKLVLNIIGQFLPNPQDALVKGIIVADNNLRELSSVLPSDNLIPSTLHCINVIMDSVFTADSILPEISLLIAGCKNLIQHCNNFGLNRMFSRPLLCDNLSNWDSVYVMFENLSKIFNQIQEFLVEEIHQQLLYEINLMTISSLVTFMSLFKECFESLSCEEKPTINEVVLWKYKILRYLTVLEDDSDLIKTLKSQLTELFEEKFILHDYHYIALFLDPDFKGMKFLTITQRQRIIDKVTEMIKSENYNDAVDLYSPKRKKCCKEDRFAEFRDSNSEGEDYFVSEVKQYIYHQNTELDILEFWKNAVNFPRLQKLSTKILNIPSSSACSDRGFSTDGTVLRDQRSRVLSEDYDMILFLNQNMKTGN